MLRIGSIRHNCISIIDQNDYNDQEKEDEMRRACSRNGKKEECIYDIGGKTRRKETTTKTKT
jgi:hypothetical protein